jgi:hypothetical protein
MLQLQQWPLPQSSLRQCQHRYRHVSGAHSMHANKKQHPSQCSSDNAQTIACTQCRSLRHCRSASASAHNTGNSDTFSPSRRALTVLANARCTCFLTSSLIGFTLSVHVVLCQYSAASGSGADQSHQRYCTCAPTLTFESYTALAVHMLLFFSSHPLMHTHAHSAAVPTPVPTGTVTVYDVH